MNNHQLLSQWSCPSNTQTLCETNSLSKKSMTTGQHADTGMHETAGTSASATMTIGGRIDAAYIYLDKKYLIGAKMLYFFLNLVLYAFYALRGPFLKGYVELTTLQYGLVASSMALVSLPGIAFWSAFADHFGRHKTTLTGIVVGSTASFGMLYHFEAAASLVSPMTYTLIVLSVYSFFTAGMQPLLDYEVLKLLSARSAMEQGLYGRQCMWGTIAYMVVTPLTAFMMGHGGYGYNALFVFIPIVTVIFALVNYKSGPPDTLRARSRESGPPDAEKNRSSDDRLENGSSAATKQNQTTLRPFGTIEKESAEIIRTSPYLSSSPSSAVQLLPLISATSTTPATATPQPGKGPQTHEMTLLLPSRDAKCHTTGSAEQQTPADMATPLGVKRTSPWLEILSKPRFLFFLLIMFFTGLTRAILNNFLAIFWTESMKLQKEQVAFVSISGSVMELAVFFFGKALAPIGDHWMLILAQLAMIVRCWIYYFIPEEPGWFYPLMLVELLKGFSFGFAHSIGVKWASREAPLGLEATAQSLYNAAYSQMPLILSASLGGFWYERHGPKVLFIMTAGGSTLALLMVSVKFFLEGHIMAFLHCGRDKDGGNGGVSTSQCHCSRVPPAATLPGVMATAESVLTASSPTSELDVFGVQKIDDESPPNAASISINN